MTIFFSLLLIQLFVPLQNNKSIGILHQTFIQNSVLSQE